MAWLIKVKKSLMVSFSLKCVFILKFKLLVAARSVLKSIAITKTTTVLFL